MVPCGAVPQVAIRRTKYGLGAVLLAIQVRDQAMAPYLEPGDIALLDLLATPEPNNIVAITADGGTTCTFQRHQTSTRIVNRAAHDIIGVATHRITKIT